MITIKDFLEMIKYRINGGDEYQWKAFGSHAYTIDYWDGKHDGCSAYAIYDIKDQTVYQIELADYRNDRIYLWTNPEFVEAHNAECKARGFLPDSAWDDKKYIILEDPQDVLEKGRAIVNNEPYDTRVSIPIDIPEKELLMLFSMAHKQDITFNQLMENILSEACTDVLGEKNDCK